MGSVVFYIQSPRPRHFDSAVPEPHSEGSCLRLKEIMQMNSGWSMLGNILLQKWMDHLELSKTDDGFNCFCFTGLLNFEACFGGWELPMSQRFYHQFFIIFQFL